LTHFVFLLAILFAAPFLNRKKPYYVFSFIILFIFLTLRYNYGNDYMGYQTIYTNINLGLPAYGEEDVLFKYVNLIFPSFYLLIAAISFLYIYTLHNLITNNSKIQNYWISILIMLINPYLFLIHLSSIRQTIAICFVVMAINYAIKRNIFIYFLLIIIASGFHQSAIILLPLYFVLNESKINSKWIILIFVSIMGLLCTPIMDTILNIVLKYFPKYSYYVQVGLQSSLRTTILSSIIFIIVIYNINKLEGKEIIYGKLSLIATSISLLSSKFAILSRFGMYFDIFLIITIVHILEKIRSKSHKQIIFVIIIFIYLLRYISFFSNPSWNTFYGNYETIISHMQL